MFGNSMYSSGVFERVVCVCVSHTPLFAKKKSEWSAAEGRRDVVEDGCGVVGRIRCGR